MKSPKIRFNGFIDEWNDVVLKDAMSKISLKNKNLDVTYVESISNTRGFIPQTSQFGDRLVASKDLSNYTIVTEGDIAYNPSRINVGSIALKATGSNVSVISPLYVAFRVKYDTLSSQFLMNWLNTSKFDRQRANASEGGVRDTLSYGSFSKFKIQLPTLPEQQKIGALFSKYDAIIALREQKLEELNALKKGMLQQMFDDGVTHKPQVRFSGFSDEWVEKKLGELLKERKTTQPQSNDAPLVSFTVENGVTPKTDRYDREGLVTGDKYAKRYKLTLLDDIVYNPANLKFGAISRNKFGKAVFSPIYVTYFQKDGDSDMRFVEMIVTSDSFIKHVRKYEQGTVYERQSVSSSDMLKAVIQLPTLPEQQKIGALFEKLDAEIVAEQVKTDWLKEQKKGLLERVL